MGKKDNRFAMIVQGKDTLSLTHYILLKEERVLVKIFMPGHCFFCFLYGMGILYIGRDPPSIGWYPGTIRFKDHRKFKSRQEAMQFFAIVDHIGPGKRYAQLISQLQQFPFVR
jgi:hypothetical protein